MNKKRRNLSGDFLVASILIIIILMLGLAGMIENADAHTSGNHARLARSYKQALSKCRTVECKVETGFTYGTHRRVIAKRAVKVAWCESTMRPRARNGQHWGLFQLNKDARRTYRWTSPVMGQVAAALRMYRARHWQPWDASARCWR